MSLPSTAPAAPPEPLEGAPAHITTETALVESSAEPGAQDGAGAQIRIDPPWPGYEKQSAAEIVEHVRNAEAGELSLVALYESAHRNRRSVRAAAERELRTRS